MNWLGEPAWVSVCGEVRAVVSELRERLLYLGSIDGSVNLLNAPHPRRLPCPTDAWPNQGGHRFWLGPQKHWVWPPPAEWEYSAAAEARSEADTLILRQPHIDSRFPAITREYAWEGDRLRCTARWQDNGTAYFGMHVVAVDLPFVAKAQLAPAATAPHGFVEVHMEGARRDGFLPNPAVSIANAEAALVAGRRIFKAGFMPQPLTVSRAKGWRLSVLPGPNVGHASDAPDHGFLSQVWVGTDIHDWAELEQLTPYLRGDTHGRCASSIYIVATPPGC